MDDHDDVQEQLPASLDEEATRQELVPFLGDDLAAAMTSKGGIYVLNAHERASLTPSIAGLRQNCAQN